MDTKNTILLTVAVIFIVGIVGLGGTQKIPNTPNTTATTTETKPETKNQPITNSTKSMSTATITTNKGVITLELYGDQAPKTVANFKKLASDGFYNGTRFHRVIKGFMIQGGDPNSKDMSKVGTWGMGGPGYKFNDEIDPASSLYKTGYKRGVLAMANSGPNTNGSQFFIMHQDYPLPPNYTIFGKVTSGLDVVDAIATTPTGAQDRPVSDMIIEKMEVK